MVIYNLDVKYIPGCPGKTHTPLFVDTDAVLACTVPFQCLQALPWWRPEKIKSRRSMQLNQLPLSHSTVSGVKMGRPRDYLVKPLRKKK